MSHKIITVKGQYYDIRLLKETKSKSCKTYALIDTKQPLAHPWKPANLCKTEKTFVSKSDVIENSTHFTGDTIILSCEGKSYSEQTKSLETKAMDQCECKLEYICIGHQSDVPKRGQWIMQYDPVHLGAWGRLFGERCRISFFFDEKDKCLYIARIEFTEYLAPNYFVEHESESEEGV